MALGQSILHGTLRLCITVHLVVFIVAVFKLADRQHHTDGHLTTNEKKVNSSRYVQNVTITAQVMSRIDGYRGFCRGQNMIEDAVQQVLLLCPRVRRSGCYTQNLTQVFQRSRSARLQCKGFRRALMGDVTPLQLQQVERPRVLCRLQLRDHTYPVLNTQREDANCRTGHEQVDMVCVGRTYESVRIVNFSVTSHHVGDIVGRFPISKSQRVRRVLALVTNSFAMLLLSQEHARNAGCCCDCL